MRLLPALLFLLALTGVPRAEPGAEASALERSRDQLRAAVGHWSVVTEFLNEDGSTARSVTGTYDFSWVVPDRVVAGRSSIPELDQAAGILFYIDEAQGNIEMAAVGGDGRLWIMTGPLGAEERLSREFPTADGGTGRLRFTRSDVTRYAFESRMEHTSDGGATWLPGNRQRFTRETEPVVGLPCEGCDAVFAGMPEHLEAFARIAGPDEPGERLRIEGTVRDAAGAAAAGVIVYAYQTDARGLYPAADAALQGRAAARHGRLRAWALTDAEGRYRFETIRPAGYPDTDLPAHVHMHVIEPGRCTYYIDDVMFADDPRLTASARRSLTSGRGGDGVAEPRRDPDGTWLVTRDIVLGEGVPGYPTGAR